MSEFPTNEDIQRHLNLAFSVNYMVLDNFRHVDPMNHQGVFSSADIFAKKSLQQKTYEDLYKDYAEERTKCFAEIQKFFDGYDVPVQFEENACLLMALYNKATESKLSLNEVFSSKELKSFHYLEQMEEVLKNSTASTLKDRACAYLALQQFARFYEKYKIWLSASEIFDTLKEDITDHGCKSLSFNHPTNKSVFLIDRSTYDSFMSPILSFVIAKERELKAKKAQLIRQIKAGNTELDDELDTVTMQLLASKIIIEDNSLIEKRFKSANKKPKPNSKISALLDTILSKLIFNETDFFVDNIYVHKHEIFDLAQALSFIPELKEKSKSLMNILYGSEQDLSKLNPKQKENT